MIVGRFRIGGVCGPSQPTKRRSTTRCDADQRRLLPLVNAGREAVIRRPAWSPRRSCQSPRPLPSPGGQTSGSTQLPEPPPGGVKWTGCGIPSASPRATTRQPGGRAGHHRCGSVEGCPRAGARSGCARLTGRPTTLSAQDQKIGPSLGRRTSRTTEKPREASRAFLLANPAASTYWRRWQGVGRTSWPISRIL